MSWVSPRKIPLLLRPISHSEARSLINKSLPKLVPKRYVEYVVHGICHAYFLLCYNYYAFTHLDEMQCFIQ